MSEQLQQMQMALRDELLESSYQIDAYLDAAHRITTDDQISGYTVPRLLEEARRQLDLMRQKIENTNDVGRAKKESSLGPAQGA